MQKQILSNVLPCMWQVISERKWHCYTVWWNFYQIILLFYLNDNSNSLEECSEESKRYDNYHNTRETVYGQKH